MGDRDLDLATVQRLCADLTNRAVIDVGAARGAFVDAVLAAGCAPVYAFEPSGPGAQRLRARFRDRPAVRVLEMALGARDRPVTSGQDAPVACRSLASLVEDGTLPREVGVLKVDTAGHALDVVRGMGRLAPAIVVAAYRDSGPGTSGGDPTSLARLRDALGARGFSHAAVVKRRDGFQAIQIDSLAATPGDRTTAIFVHASAHAALAPALAEATAGSLAKLMDAAVDLRRRARRRLAVTRALRARLELARLGRPGRLAPRIGVLRHHDPRPLEIPDHYRQVRLEAPRPRVSVVTATLDAGRFLERTIRSVLDQGYPNLEYVIQDGGSTDGTREILERYRAAVTGVHVGKDGGQADALNRGFARTTGEIMAYLNGDDLLLPGALAYVADFFATHPAVDAVYGHRVLVDERDREIGRWVLPRHDRRILAWADYVPQESLFWRRSLWERVGGRLDPSYHFAMDWELLLRFRASGARFVRLPRFLGAFRVHRDQKTVSRMGDVGAREMARLREREHGRAVSEAEVRRHVRGYLVRHVVYQKLYRLGVLRY